MELRGGELRASRGDVVVEQLLRFGHESADGARVTAIQRRASARHHRGVLRAERLADRRRGRAWRIGEATIEIGENPSRVLAAAQIDDEDVNRAPGPYGLHVHPISVEAEMRDAPAEGADLIHATALGSHAPLRRVGDLHFVAFAEPEAVDLVESARDEDARRGGRRQSLADRQIGADHEAEAASTESLGDLERHGGGVAEEPTTRGRARQRFVRRGDSLRPVCRTAGGDARDLENAVALLDVAVHALVRSGDEAMSGGDLGMRPPIRAGPVRMLAEEAEAPRNEERGRRTAAEVCAGLSSADRTAHMDTSEAIAAFTSDPKEFLQKNCVIIAGGSTRNPGRTIFKMASSSVARGPGTVLRMRSKLRTSWSVNISNNNGGNPDGAKLGADEFVGYYIPMKQMSDTTNVFGQAPTDGSVGLLLTSQLTGCTFGFATQNGHFSAGHIQPQKNVQRVVNEINMRSKLGQGLGANARLVEKGIDYDDIATIVGIFKNGAWKVYMQRIDVKDCVKHIAGIVQIGRASCRERV